VLAAGCGSGEDSGFTEDDVGQALNLHYGGNDLLYEYQPGTDCIVTDVFTSSDEVDQARSAAGGLDAAVATNSDGTAGVAFGGYTGFSPDECVPAAEQALDSLSSSG
jgi:hypothetical protein